MIHNSKVPGLFEGTARYYACYRRNYPSEVIDLLHNRFNLNSLTHVLDLGCGTGQLAIPLAARSIAVHALDPDFEMLSEGLRAEQQNNVRGIAWYIGDERAFRPTTSTTTSTMYNGCQFPLDGSRSALNSP